VWVFVDYNDNGTMRRLPLLAGATLTETSAPGIGKVEYAEDNDQGVWVIGNAKTAGSGSFSATVQLLTGTPGVAGACAYASNYPPVAEYVSDTKISFTGTPDYKILLTNIHSGATLTVTSGKDFMSLPDYEITSFSDATGAPGIFPCVPPVAPAVAKGEFCYAQSGALVAVTSGSATVMWYDAPTAGNLVYTGNVLFLPPLYDTSAEYYAQAVLNEKCQSARIAAESTVSNCAISGECPDYTACSVGADTATAVACSAFYAGQIGPADYPAACVAFDAGRIGSSQ
jgi:hypothetical protein